MNRILILKNDRVGDLFNSLDGINAILVDNPNVKIEIILSEISQQLSFLFDKENVTVTFLPYRLKISDKLNRDSKFHDLTYRCVRGMSIFDLCTHKRLLGWAAESHCPESIDQGCIL